MEIKIKQLDYNYDFKRKGEPFKDRNKIYIWVDGETLMENLENRRSRPHKFYREEVFPLIWEELKKKNLFKEVMNMTWRWSQKTGCSMCSCSPGFYSEEGGLLNIHVTVTSKKNKTMLKTKV